MKGLISWGDDDTPVYSDTEQEHFYSQLAVLSFAAKCSLAMFQMISLKQK